MKCVMVFACICNSIQTSVLYVLVLIGEMWGVFHLKLEKCNNKKMRLFFSDDFFDWQTTYFTLYTPSLHASFVIKREDIYIYMHLDKLDQKLDWLLCTILFPALLVFFINRNLITFFLFYLLGNFLLEGIIDTFCGIL